MEEQIKKNEWKLKSLEFKFVKGYSFDKSVDRYEGKIQFENDDSEMFSVKLRDDMCKPYLDLVAKEVVNNAEELYKRLYDSL